MSTLHACLALAGLLQASGGAPQDDPLDGLPARAPIAGLVGFQAQSTVTFDAAPQDPHDLELMAIFPARLRFALASRSAGAGARQIVYRCGARYFTLEPQQTKSIEIVEPDARRANCAAFGLREALFLWPDGHEWQGQGATRQAHTECGELVATLGADGRPTSIRMDTGQPAPESFRDITWREQHQRWWPSSFDFHVGDARVWGERVDRIDTRVAALEIFFVPPDRRLSSPAPSQHYTRAWSGEIPAGYGLRVALPAEASWVDVAREFRAATAPHARPDERAWKLEPGAWIELSERGRPTHLVLRFRPGTAEPPEGVQEAIEQVALFASVVGADLDFERSLKAVRALAPAGSRPAVAYARFVAAPRLDEPFQIVVGLEEAP